MMLEKAPLKTAGLLVLPKHPGGLFCITLQAYFVSGFTSLSTSLTISSLPGEEAW